jgi:RimJ/RimL family protein N-acetyltransferase
VIIGPHTVTLRDGRAIVLRSCGPDDVVRLLEYLRGLFRESWRNLNSPADQFDRVTPEEQLQWIERVRASDRELECSAFADDGAIIGSAYVAGALKPFTRHCAELGLGVRAAWHGHGVGRAMLERSVAESAQRGLWNMTLHVRTYNEPAIALYERAGFVRKARLESVALVDGTFVDEYLYQRIEVPSPAGGRTTIS